MIHSEKAWYRNATIYQVYPKSFQDSGGDGVGDIRGIIRRLDYLTDLGVDGVWLCPIYASPMVDNGYDISDYRSINPDFGTMEDFDELVEEMHRRNLKLIMDMVLNHTSDEHAWFKESRTSRTSPKRDWYHWKGSDKNKSPNDWLSFFSGPAWEWDELSGEHYLHLFHKKQPDLNWENPELREEVKSMLRWWLDKGVDGFRLDVINLISKQAGYPDADPDCPAEQPRGISRYANGPRIHEFLRELHDEVFAPYNAIAIGEAPEVSPGLAEVYTAPERRELDMVFHFDLMGLDSGGQGKWDIRPLDAGDLRNVMKSWQSDIGNGWNSLYLSNHDQSRIVNRFGDAEFFRTESAKLLAALQYLQKGTAFVYQGEEIGMVNYPWKSPSELRDIESINYLKEIVKKGTLSFGEAWDAVRKKGRDNSRVPMCWSGDMNGGFSSGHPWISVHPEYNFINVENESKDDESILSFYRRLIRIRKSELLISEGDIEFIDTPWKNFIVYRRFSDASAHELIVAANVGPERRNVRESLHLPIPESEYLLRNYPLPESNDIWEPWEVRIWKVGTKGTME